MPLALGFFLQYAYAVLFLWIMAEQFGVPVPSIPILLTAGTLTATHQLALPLIILAAVGGCFVSDSLWYLMGKRFGGSMVKLVCRLSFESATCVRKTEDTFTKYGGRALLVAKFVPGLGTVAAPIAGQTRMKYPIFLGYDLAGAVLWSGTFALLGRWFGDVLEQHPQALSWVGHFAGALFLLALVGLLGYRVWQQRSFLKKVRLSRIDPADLKKMLDGGQEVYIVDLRHPLDYLPDPRVLPNAIRLSPEDLIQRSAEIPRDRDVVLYCTCPSEATAGKMAMRLHSLGIYRVRPLRGGFDEWKKLGFPLEEYREQPASVS